MVVFQNKPGINNSRDGVIEGSWRRFGRCVRTKFFRRKLTLIGISRDATGWLKAVGHIPRVWPPPRNSGR